MNTKVRLVRCPRCRNVLPEPPGVPVYKCGGCGTVLQAKKRKNGSDDQVVDNSSNQEPPVNSISHGDRDVAMKSENNTIDEPSNGVEEYSSGKRKMEQLSDDQEAASSSNQESLVTSIDKPREGDHNDVHTGHEDPESLPEIATRDVMNQDQDITKMQLSDDQEACSSSHQQSLVKSINDPDRHTGHNDPRSSTELLGQEDPESSPEATTHNGMDQDQDQDQEKDYDHDQDEDYAHDQKEDHSSGKQKMEQLSDDQEACSSSHQLSNCFHPFLLFSSIMFLVEEYNHLKIQLKDIILATDNFGPDKLIGRGGFGPVYIGELSLLEGRRSKVAIKRLNSKLGQGNNEFWKEIMTLSEYKHENLVSLLHFCFEGDERILVYEYASRGSLDRHLSDANLTWIQRLKICVGVARGLNYLHDPKGTKQRILHRDIKSANVLLDENWNAKVSDFGLSKVGPANQPHTFVVSDVVGTFGYCDPSYHETGVLTKESDVYSFGAVLFEVMCGRLCYEYENGKIISILVSMWRKCFKENRLDDIIFHDLKEQIQHDSLMTFSTIANRCLQRDHKKRPAMVDVVQELEVAIEQQLGINTNEESDEIKHTGLVKLLPTISEATPRNEEINETYIESMKNRAVSAVIDKVYTDIDEVSTTFQAGLVILRWLLQKVKRSFHRH